MKVLACILGCCIALLAEAPLTFEAIRAYPFPNELTAAATGAKIAWAFNEGGRRNLWVAEGPTFEARKVTNYNEDDGQELSSVAISPDGKHVVYVRGGDHGSNWDRSVGVNVLSSPTPVKVQVWSVPFAGGVPKLLGDGDFPEISPQSDQVAFLRERAIYTVKIGGESPATKLFTARGDSQSPAWSPDGTKLAFVSARGTHAFVGVYINAATAIQWIAPSTSRDSSPVWSPDGQSIAFVRQPGRGGAPGLLLEGQSSPWEIWSGSVATGQGRRLWKSPATKHGGFPTTHGGANLHWSSLKRIVFLSAEDGWPHLYSMPEDGGTAMLLTPGKFMLEHIAMSPDGRFAVASANTGPKAEDIDRRHVLRVNLERAQPEVLTASTGLEWTPVVLGDSKQVAYLSATAQRPPLPAIQSEGTAVRLIGAAQIPSEYPASQLIVPKTAIFQAPDGLEIHAQVFEAPGGAARKPAIVYVHGGPPRQMLLGWNYSDYYANAYATNQYLASKGYVVLAVNYRMGIGYGQDFQRPALAGVQGASEYQDVRAAGVYLSKLPQVDPKRIGVYGGSYGGFLTALALGRDSQLFAAGVDIHGVHDRTDALNGAMNRYEKSADLEQAREAAWVSSPISSVKTWKSPVLLIHGDDDRNVAFSQTVDLVQRLSAAGVPYEEIVIPDDTHHFMRQANWLRIGKATADFFDRTLGAATRDR